MMFLVNLLSKITFPWYCYPYLSKWVTELQENYGAVTSLLLGQEGSTMTVSYNKLWKRLIDELVDEEEKEVCQYRRVSFMGHIL